MQLRISDNFSSQIAISHHLLTFNEWRFFNETPPAIVCECISILLLIPKSGPETHNIGACCTASLQSIANRNFLHNNGTHLQCKRSSGISGDAGHAATCINIIAPGIAGGLLLPNTNAASQSFSSLGDTGTSP
jgi:hypothetical protein